MIRVRALSLWAPWGSLLAMGQKGPETRSWPAPKAVIGERVMIHQALRRPTDPHGERPLQVGEWTVAGHRGDYQMWTRDGRYRELPLGTIVGSGVLRECIPISGVDGCGRVTHIQPSRHGGADWLLLCWPTTGRYGPPPNSGTFDDWGTERVDAWLPYGDYSPGRWAWLFDDLALCEDRCPAGCEAFNDEDDVHEDGSPIYRIQEGEAAPIDDGFDHPAMFHLAAWVTCPVCDGRGSCAPFRVTRGWQGCWWFDPSMIVREAPCPTR